MMLSPTQHQQVLHDGYTIIRGVYTTDELDAIKAVIDYSESANPTFCRTADLFAIRQFLKELPKVAELVFSRRLSALIGELFGNDYFAVKSIYFDKPERSNWFVAWHRDLTISVSEKIDIPGFSNWTNKHNQFAVQPPVEILADNFTVRIHLDDTDQHNGALKVVPGSHLDKIPCPDKTDQQICCDVGAGGVMVMRPLLLHASARSTNNKMRRVIHIEFSKAELPGGLSWAERMFYCAP